MEEFFQIQSSQTNNGEVLWFENEAFLMNQSAFASFRNQSIEGFGVSGYGNVSANHRNMNKRMMEFLKKSWIPKIGEVKMEREKVHKHMIKERIRREKQKQSYLDLHKLLPMGTKVSTFPYLQLTGSSCGSSHNTCIRVDCLHHIFGVRPFPGPNCPLKFFGLVIYILHISWFQYFNFFLLFKHLIFWEAYHKSFNAP